jgi:hypothetical protein
MFENMTISEVLKLLGPLLIINYGMVVFCIYRLIKDRVKYLPKWVWALIIILLEFIGPLYFLLVGRERE